LTLTAVPGRDEVCASVNEAADKLYKEILSREMMAQMRRWISAPVKARIRSLKRRAAKIGEDLRKARQRAERQEEGELLKGNLHRAQKGLAEIRVQDWTTGASRTIRLDPRLDAVANMEKIFRDAGKGKRGMAKAEERLHETEDECRGLEDLLYCIEAAEDLATLESLGHELEGVRRKAEPGKSKERPRKHREQRQVSPGTPYRALWTPEGRRLWVGKTGRGNDLLVKEKARSGDLWFHVKDRPGAHVVLAVRGKESPGPEEEEFAARVAAHFSKARGRGKVEVMVAHAEQVHRPNNAMPGQVHVSSYRTLLVESMDPFTGPE
jgi:predicted ribosome quality control (RQC) complex YloA/Tae2 family protein